MNIYQLKYFYDAVRLKSVTLAASENFVTQSAVSQAIKALENSLESNLIYHKKNSFQLTQEGQVVFENCGRVFEVLDNLKTRTKNAKNKVAGSIRIAATNSIALTFLSGHLNNIATKFPDLEIIVKLGNSDQVKDYLVKNEAEIGFILNEEHMQNFESVPLKTGKFLLVTSQKANIRSVPESIMITRKNKIEIKELSNSWQKKYKKNPHFQLELFSWELIRQLCLDGKGTGYLPDYLVEKDIYAKKLFVLKNSVKTFSYTLLALQVKGKVQSLNVKTFLKELN